MATHSHSIPQLLGLFVMAPTLLISILFNLDVSRPTPDGTPMSSESAIERPAMPYFYIYS